MMRACANELGANELSAVQGVDKSTSKMESVPAATPRLAIMAPSKGEESSLSDDSVTELVSPTDGDLDDQSAEQAGPLKR